MIDTIYLRAKLESLVKSIVFYIYLLSEYIVEKTSDFMDYLVQFSDLVKENEIIYFDFETTGLNPYHANIIDYAFLFEEENSEETYIESLVNPQTKFEKVITDITGIHPEELEDKPIIEKQIPNIYYFINYEHRQIASKPIPTAYMVAHNCDGFDKVFLMRLFEDRKKYPLVKNWKFIDTLPLAKKLLPNLKSHSLKSLSTHFNIKAGTHRALSDTICLKKVFHELVNMLCAKESHIKSYYMENPKKIIDYYSFN